MDVWSYVGLVIGMSVAGGIVVTIGVIALAYLDPRWRSQALVELDRELERRGWGRGLPLTSNRVERREALARWARREADEDGPSQLEDRTRALLKLADLPAEESDIAVMVARVDSVSEARAQSVRGALSGCRDVDRVLGEFRRIVLRCARETLVAGFKEFWPVVSARVVNRLVKAIELGTVSVGRLGYRQLSLRLEPTARVARLADVRRPVRVGESR